MNPYSFTQIRNRVLSLKNSLFTVKQTESITSVKHTFTWRSCGELWLFQVVSAFCIHLHSTYVIQWSHIGERDSTLQLAWRYLACTLTSVHGITWSLHIWHYDYVSSADCLHSVSISKTFWMLMWMFNLNKMPHILFKVAHRADEDVFEMSNPLQSLDVSFF